MSSEPVAIEQNDYKVADISEADFGLRNIGNLVIVLFDGNGFAAHGFLLVDF